MKISAVGVVALLGCLSGAAVFLPFADIYGRRPLNIFFAFWQVVAMVVLYANLLIAPDFYLLLVIAFVASASSYPRASNVFCYLIEITTDDQKGHITFLGQVFIALATLYVGFHFSLFKDVLSFFLPLTFFLIFSLFFSYYYCPESPHYSLLSGKKEQFFETIETIAKVNSRERELREDRGALEQ